MTTPGRLNPMLTHLRPFLIGFVIAFGGWLAIAVIGLLDIALLLALVVIGAVVAVVARRPASLAGAVVGLLVYPLAVAITSPASLGDGWPFYAVLFTALVATGFAGGRAAVQFRRELAARG